MLKATIHLIPKMLSLEIESKNVCMEKVRAAFNPCLIK